MRAIAIVIGIVLTACVSFEPGDPRVVILADGEPEVIENGPIDFEPICVISVSDPTPESAPVGMCFTTFDFDVVCPLAIAEVQTFRRYVLLWTRLFQPGAPGTGLVEGSYHCNESIRILYLTPCDTPIFVDVGFQHPTMGGDPYALLNRGRKGSCQGETPSSDPS